ncbi:co-chaperone DjlA [Lentisphaera profundi]|uniref:Co-chaperone DjlA n=1 Tax=Lentisphaera profundi TaxID=1658616 RepID=A0ABY7VT57_9BACT|nr:co-chaperone DjlA [Lentisphaera profundi]WDE95323.1 co-chaperone DjlA [Lentisphaera profundi]
MSWFGKITGGTIGFMIGGPLGAMAGAALGHTLIDAETSTNQPRISSREEQEMIFFVTIFTLVGKMAKADGKITKEEIDFIEHFIKHQLKLEPKQREYAISIVRAAKDDNTPILDYLKQFVQVFPQADMHFMLYEVLFTVAMADGHIHPDEEAILRKISPYLKVQRNVFEAMEARFRQGRSGQSSASELANHYQILECTPEMTDIEIKKVYRKKCREFHPDTLASRGLSEEFMDFANKEIVKINEAYEAIKKSRAK